MQQPANPKATPKDDNMTRLIRLAAFFDFDETLPECVGHPQVVAPNNILEKIAHLRSWPILSFR